MPTLSSRLAGGALALLCAAGGIAVAVGPANAAPLRHPAPVCTQTPDQVTALSDQLTGLRGQLAGRKLTTVQRTALKAAITELVTAARNAKLPADVRAAKLTELNGLLIQLRTVKSAEERTALRTQIAAVRLELRTARLTGPERAALAVQIRTLSDTYAGRLSRVQAQAIRAQIAAIGVTLRGCAV